MSHQPELDAESATLMVVSVLQSSDSSADRRAAALSALLVIAKRQPEVAARATVTSAVCTTLEVHSALKEVALHGCLLVQHLLECGRALTDAPRVFRALVLALNRHVSDAAVATCGCNALRLATLASRANCAHLRDAEAMQTAVCAMMLHGSCVAIVSAACETVSMLSHECAAHNTCCDAAVASLCALLHTHATERNVVVHALSALWTLATSVNGNAALRRVNDLTWLQPVLLAHAADVQVLNVYRGLLHQIVGSGWTCLASVQTDVTNALMTVLKLPDSAAEVAQQTCTMLYLLMASFGCAKAVESGCLEVVFSVLRRHEDVCETAAAALSILALTTVADACVMSQKDMCDATALVLLAMKRHATSAFLTCLGCRVLSALKSSDDVDNVVDAVLTAARNHPRSHSVAVSACRALRALCASHAYCESVLKHASFKAVLQTLLRFEDELKCEAVVIVAALATCNPAQASDVLTDVVDALKSASLSMWEHSSALFCVLARASALDSHHEALCIKAVGIAMRYGRSVSVKITRLYCETLVGYARKSARDVGADSNMTCALATVLGSCRDEIVAASACEALRLVLQAKYFRGESRSITDALLHVLEHHSNTEAVVTHACAIFLLMAANRCLAFSDANRSRAAPVLANVLRVHDTTVCMAARICAALRACATVQSIKLDVSNVEAVLLVLERHAASASLVAEACSVLLAADAVVPASNVLPMLLLDVHADHPKVVRKVCRVLARGCAVTAAFASAVVQALKRNAADDRCVGAICALLRCVWCDDLLAAVHQANVAELLLSFLCTAEMTMRTAVDVCATFCLLASELVATREATVIQAALKLLHSFNVFDDVVQAACSLLCLSVASLTSASDAATFDCTKSLLKALHFHAEKLSVAISICKALRCILDNTHGLVYFIAHDGVHAVRAVSRRHAQDDALNRVCRDIFDVVAKTSIGRVLVV